MSIDDVKVVIGNKVYQSSAANYEQTCCDFPRIEVDAYLAPLYCLGKYTPPSQTTTIKNVIFNPPATIIFWSDNTKTVVKCDDSYETYDPEKGLAMAISKKLMGDNKFEYYNTFLHWLKKWDKQHPDMQATKTEETVQEPDESASSIECRWDPGFSL
jgi:hypothetical protein